MTATIQTTTRKPADVAADGLIVFQFEKAKDTAVSSGRYAARIKQEVKRRGFSGAAGETITFDVGAAAKRKTIIVTGLGRRDAFDTEALLLAAASAVAQARAQRVRTVAAGVVTASGMDDAAGLVRTALGMSLGLYRFDKYKSDAPKSDWPKKIVLSSAADDAKEVVERAQGVASGVALARDLVNEPPAAMNPGSMVSIARRVARESNLTIKVLGPRQIQQQDMHALAAVARGSDIDPKVIHLTYKPKKRAKARLAWIGKGVTFDSGGYNLKLGDNILAMKCDMAGSAAVLGAMSALAAVDAPVEVHGVLGMVENLVSGNAYKPGDVLQTRAGKTVEIVNTDAEGRLVLADLLDYTASEIKPDSMVDLATLTGACVVALGPLATGLMGSDPQLIEKMRECAADAGEKFWPLPLYEEYLDQLRSEIADLRNAGKRYGGALTAGLFLREFVSKKIPWVHLDIAGPAYLDAKHAYHGQGGTGAGVTTLLHYALSV